MGEKCPACGHPIVRKHLDTDGVLCLMRLYPESDLYEGQDGNFYLTYGKMGGGFTTRGVVADLCRRGLINYTYPPLPDMARANVYKLTSETRVFPRNTKRRA